MATSCFFASKTPAKSTSRSITVKAFFIVVSSWLRGRRAEGPRAKGTGETVLPLCPLAPRPLFPNLRIRDGSAHRQHFSTGPFRSNPHAALLTVFQRPNGNGKLIAGFQSRAGPSPALEEIGAHSFDAPRLDDALFVG